MQIEVDSLADDVKSWIHNAEKGESVVFTKQGQAIAHIAIATQKSTQQENKQKTNLQTLDKKQDVATVTNLYKLFSDYAGDDAIEKQIVEIR